MKKILGVLRIVVLICALSIVSTNTWALICDNGSGTGYGEGSTESGTKTSNSSSIIEQKVERSGGYYLSAQATVFTILHRIEVQGLEGIDFIELQNLTAQALDQIRKTREHYIDLFYTALSTPYNNEILFKLRNFDYDDFRKRYQLNTEIFSEVSCYLKYGDIDGIFLRNVEVCIILEKLLVSLESAFLKNEIPDLKIFWKLNELFSETSIFGSYVARVFHQI